MYSIQGIIRVNKIYLNSLRAFMKCHNSARVSIPTTTLYIIFYESQTDNLLYFIITYRQTCISRDGQNITRGNR